MKTRGDLLKILRENLSPSRVRHSLSVAVLARKMGQRFGWDPEMAFRAGLLHDVAKEWPSKRLDAHVRKFKLKVPEAAFIRRHNPALFHSYVSAGLAKRNGWLTNPAALKAIAAHTLGRLNMGTADKILYVADLIALDRDFPEVRMVRRMAFKNLDDAFVASLAVKISTNLRESKPLYPLTIRMWNQVARGGSKRKK
jgi:predicted HD superfamily hydrolase involved in NAD metabolism